MKENSDYIFIPKAEINEGLTSGKVSKVAVYFTTQYFFVIPFDRVHLWNSINNDIKNAKAFIEDLNNKAKSMTVDEFQNSCIDFLPNNRIYKVENLDKFSIQTGFLFFGGMRVKKKGEQVQALNIKPKSVRAQIKKFYEL